MSVLNGPLCEAIFQSCRLSKLWVYPYEGERPPWDDKDFDDQIIVDNLRGILELPEMKKDSVLILNLGLHYMESVSYRDYQILLNKVLDLLNEKESDSGELKYKTRVIWKTSTSLSKEKDTGGQLKSDRRRFLTLPVRNVRNLAINSSHCAIIFGAFIACATMLIPNNRALLAGRLIEKIKLLLLEKWPKRHSPRSYCDTIVR